MSREYEECDGRWLFASPIEEGSGVIHVNRFRLYFYVQSLAELEKISLLLINKFEEYMSSYFTNLAHVNRHKGKMGSVFFQFVLNDPKGLAMDDWVKVIWHNNRQGLAVETQQYIEIGGYRAHFLCGRRSWVVGRANPENTRTNPAVSLAQGVAQAAMTEQTHVYHVRLRCFIETAAVERFSSLLIRIVSTLDPSTPLPVRLQVQIIWTTMLNKFAKYHNLETFSPINPFLTGPTTDEKAGVFYQATEHENASDLLADPCVKEILGLHPGLASQRYTAI